MCVPTSRERDLLLAQRQHVRPQTRQTVTPRLLVGILRLHQKSTPSAGTFARCVSALQILKRTIHIYVPFYTYVNDNFVDYLGTNLLLWFIKHDSVLDSKHALENVYNNSPLRFWFETHTPLNLKYFLFRSLPILVQRWSHLILVFKLLPQAILILDPSRIQTNSTLLLLRGPCSDFGFHSALWSNFVWGSNLLEIKFVSGWSF